MMLLLVNKRDGNVSLTPVSESLIWTNSDAPTPVMQVVTLSLRGHPNWGSYNNPLSPEVNSTLRQPFRVFSFVTC